MSENIEQMHSKFPRVQGNFFKFLNQQSEAQSSFVVYYRQTRADSAACCKSEQLTVKVEIQSCAVSRILGGKNPKQTPPNLSADGGEAEMILL